MSRYTPNSIHRYDILNCHQCGCYYCLATFPPAEITEWCDEDEKGIGLTALCPKCSIDSVIGALTSEDIDPRHLKEMHDRGFGSAR